MIGLAIKMLTLGIYEIFCAKDVRVKEGWYLIAILEASVEHGDSHASSPHADVMQAMALEHFYLLAAVAVILSSDAVPGIPSLVDLYFWRSALNGIGRYPHLTGCLDKVKSR